MILQPLPPQFRPRQVALMLPVIGRFVEAAEEELRRKALRDANGCCGYFPAMSGVAGIADDLPASRRLSEELPAVKLDGTPLHFNFVRLSLVKQLGPSPFHLDSDASTALSGSIATLGQRLVSRLLLNLSSTSARTLCFLNVDPFSVHLAVRDGYIHFRGQVPPDLIETAVLRPRDGRRVSGILLAANRVLHSGRDDESGHFVIAFGREDATGGTARAVETCPRPCVVTAAP